MGRASKRRVHPIGGEILSFVRAQVVALSATLTDFFIFFSSLWLLQQGPGLSTLAGTIAGGAVAFVANRHWSFLAGRSSVLWQGVKYSLVWAASAYLNVAAVEYLVRHGSAPAARVAAAVLVGIFFNFPLHRFFVFQHAAGSAVPLQAQNSARSVSSR